MRPLLFEVFRETEADAEVLIEEYIEMYKSLEDGGDTAKQVDALRRQIELAQKKKASCWATTPRGSLLTGISSP